MAESQQDAVLAERRDGEPPVVVALDELFERDDVALGRAALGAGPGLVDLAVGALAHGHEVREGEGRLLGPLAAGRSRGRRAGPVPLPRRAGARFLGGPRHRGGRRAVTRRVRGATWSTGIHVVRGARARVSPLLRRAARRPRAPPERRDPRWLGAKASPAGIRSYEENGASPGAARGARAAGRRVPLPGRRPTSAISSPGGRGSPWCRPRRSWRPTQRGLGPKTGRRFNAGASRTAPKEELTKTPRPRPAGGETESLGVGRSCSRLNRRREKPGSPRGVWPLSCGEDELRRGTSAAASSSRFAARRRRGFAGASVPSRHRARAYPLEMHITNVTTSPCTSWSLSSTCRTACSTRSCTASS